MNNHLALAEEHSLAQKLGDQARIRELEQLIPGLINQIGNATPVDRPKLDNRLHELSQEYFERAGVHYRPPNPQKICRRYGAGA